jgi:hypothetical protein
MNKREKIDHYVDNQKFYEEMSKYKEKWNYAKENGLPRPEIPRYIGECFLKIATHLSYLPKFVNYMYREDMISDAVENSIQYIHNFDPNYVSPKGKKMNPFAYFTQISYYAFLRRIGKEKRQVEIKEKILEKTCYDQVFTADESGDTSEYDSIKNSIQYKYY